MGFNRENNKSLDFAVVFTAPQTSKSLKVTKKTK